MTKEQEKAIERCNKLIETEHSNWIGISNQKAIETVLNMLKEKDTEIEKLKRDFKIVDEECSRLERKEAKQDKMIDLMVEEIYLLHTSLIEEYGDYKTQFSENGEEVSKENIKQYYDRESRG